MEVQSSGWATPPVQHRCWSWRFQVQSSERGEKEPGAAVLLAIRREFGKSVDWLLTAKNEK